MRTDTDRWDEAFRKATVDGFGEWIDWDIGFVTYVTNTLAKVNDTYAMGVVVRPLGTTDDPSTFRCRMETTSWGGEGKADYLVVEAAPIAVSLAKFGRLVEAWCLDARGLHGMVKMTAKVGDANPLAA